MKKRILLLSIAIIVLLSTLFAVSSFATEIEEAAADLDLQSMKLAGYHEERKAIRVKFSFDEDYAFDSRVVEIGGLVRKDGENAPDLVINTDGSLGSSRGIAKIVVFENGVQVGNVFEVTDEGRVVYTTYLYNLLTETRNNLNTEYSFIGYAILKDSLGNREVVYTSAYNRVSYNKLVCRALGHIWDEGAVTVQPTKTSEGVRTFTCERCGGTNTETIDMLRNVSFESAFADSDTVLYRVGNSNAVKFGSLFKENGTDEAIDSSVSVTATPVDAAANVSAVVTANGSDWTNGTIQFTGCGPVLLTLTDENGDEYSYYTEVVNGYNVTKYSELQNRNSVLLNDVTLNSGSRYALVGGTLYGNGFTFDVSNGNYAGSGTFSSNYLVFLNNSTLNNVVITGAEYPVCNIESSRDYNNATVLTFGDSEILNSYISNCCTPVRAMSGTLLLENTTLFGGAFCNLEIRNSHVTADNLTTVNQADSNTMFGLGIVIYYEGVTDGGIDIIGDLHQYNVISSTDYENITNTYSRAVIGEVFMNDDYAGYIKTIDGVKYVNAGIISTTELSDTVTVSSSNENLGYTGTEIEFHGITGYLYSTTDPTPQTPPAYVSEGQAAIKPKFTFDRTGDTYAGGKLLITFLEGESATWNADRVSCIYNGAAVTGNISVSGDNAGGYSYNPTEKTVTFTEAGNYSVNYSGFTVTGNYRLNNGEIEKYTLQYEKKTDVSVITSAAPPEVAYVNGTSTTVDLGNNEYLILSDDAMANGTMITETTNNIGVVYENINGVSTQIYYPVVEADGAVTSTVYFYIFNDFISITDGDTVYDKDTAVKPDNLNVIWGRYSGDNKSGQNTTNSTGEYSGYNSYKDIFHYSRGGAAQVEISTYNNKAVYSISVDTANRLSHYFVVKYCYESAGNKYYYYVGYQKEVQQSQCVVEGTMITLADGTRKAVENLDGSEQLLVWDLETGSYSSAPAVFIDSDPAADNKVMYAVFSDGTEVGVVSEHGFFDLDLGRYVYINEETEKEDLIGHRFVKEGNIATDGYETVTLTDIRTETENVRVFSPVTYGHLCYYTNGMLSMPGGISGLFNIFAVNTDTMTYDSAQMNADIAQYGLLTLDDFGGLITEDMFGAFNGRYLGVAAGKGLITWDYIEYLANRYGPLCD